MQFEAGNKRGNRFKKGESGNPSGRPVKLFSEISLEWQRRGIERATPERVIEVFEYLLALPYTELKELATARGDEESPSIIQIAAEEMTGKRKREILGDMLDRAHGKSMQRQEIGGKNGGAIKIGVDISALTLEEKVKLLEIAKKAKRNE